MSEESSPLPEFFKLLDVASRTVQAGAVSQRRTDVVNLIEFIRDYDVTILAKLEDAQ